MPDDQQPPTPPAEAPLAEPSAESKRFADLDALQEEVARRIRDNQRFLDHLLDDDYTDVDAELDDDPRMEDFEEL